MNYKFKIIISRLLIDLSRITIIIKGFVFYFVCCLFVCFHVSIHIESVRKLSYFAHSFQQLLDGLQLAYTSGLLAGC